MAQSTIYKGEKMQRLVLIIALGGGCIWFWSQNNNNHSGGVLDTTSSRAIAAGSFVPPILSDVPVNPTPDPTPNPNPSPDPDKKYPRKDCPYCKGSGVIEQGDGHVTECQHCELETFSVEVNKECCLVCKSCKCTCGDSCQCKHDKECEDSLSPLNISPATYIRVAGDTMKKAEREYRAKNFELSAIYIDQTHATLSSYDIFGDGSEKSEYDAILKKVKRARVMLKEKGVKVGGLVVFDAAAWKEFEEAYAAYVKKNEAKYAKSYSDRAGNSFNSGGSCSSGGCSSCGSSSMSGGCSSCGSGRRR